MHDRDPQWSAPLSGQVLWSVVSPLATLRGPVSAETALPALRPRSSAERGRLHVYRRLIGFTVMHSVRSRTRAALTRMLTSKTGTCRAGRQRPGTPTSDRAGRSPLQLARPRSFNHETDRCIGQPACATLGWLARRRCQSRGLSGRSSRREGHGSRCGAIRSPSRRVGPAVAFPHYPFSWPVVRVHSGTRRHGMTRP